MREPLLRPISSWGLGRMDVLAWLCPLGFLAWIPWAYTSHMSCHRGPWVLRGQRLIQALESAPFVGS